MGSVLLCTKVPRLPPVTAMALAAKSGLASDRVKVMVATSPTPSVVLLLVMAMVGGVRSRVSVFMRTVLLASVPSLLKLPAASLKVLEAT